MKKLQSNRGFSLVELLCCTCILVVFAAAVSLGMNFSNRVFFTTAQNSEARTLISSINATLSDEFRFATNVKNVDTGNGTMNISYTSASYGDDAQLVLREIVKKNADGKNEASKRLAVQISGEEAPHDLLTEKTYTKGCSIDNLKVTKNDNGKDKVSGKTCKIITISYDILDRNKKVLFSESLDVIPLHE